MLSIQAWIVLFCLFVCIVFIVIASVLSPAMRNWMGKGGWVGIAILLIFSIIQGLWTVWGIDCAVRGDYGWNCSTYAWILVALVIIITIFTLVGPLIAVYVVPKQEESQTQNKPALVKGQA
jgi:hypothetical protein